MQDLRTMRLMNGSSVLVTGGAGYIGSHAVLALLEAGERAVVIDDLSTGLRAAVPEGVRCATSMSQGPIRPGVRGSPRERHFISYTSRCRRRWVGGRAWTCLAAIIRPRMDPAFGTMCTSPISRGRTSMR